MINKLDLAWQTFEFYTHELSECELTHTKMLQTLNRFVNENPSPQKYQRDRVKKKCRESHSQLIHLYKKQISSITDLITIYQKNPDIHKDLMPDMNSLHVLKNVIETLIHQINEYKINIERIL